MGRRWSTAVNSVDTAPPTFWVGESGVRSSGTSSSSCLEAPHRGVEVGVGEGRVVQDVVAPAGVLDLLGDQRGAPALLNQAFDPGSDVSYSWAHPAACRPT